MAGENLPVNQGVGNRISSRRQAASFALYLALALALGGCAPPAGSLGWERADGRAVVRRAVAAHGGLERWRRFASVTFDYREKWFPPAAWLGLNPWPRNPVQGKLTLWLHTAEAEIQFDGYEEWRFSARDQKGGRELAASGPEGARPPELDWRGAFVLPRTRYITLLPWRFLDGGARIEYQGKDGGCDVVLISFAPGTGATPEDRYQAYFDAKTGVLRRVVLTVTAYGRWAVGDLRYEDWRRVQGLLMPGRIQAYWNGLHVPLHKGEYSGYRFREAAHE